ncbi:hypothetical protein T06_7216 [Trichinella sp. T6]|nr:hypothetical protein T06_7216 [Trichinella sp. T6]
MTNGHRAVILWQEYVDVILSKLSTPPLACFPFGRKPGCHCAFHLEPSTLSEYAVKSYHMCHYELLGPLPCRESLPSIGSSREFHLTACQCRFAYSMRSSTLSNRLPKT